MPKSAGEYLWYLPFCVTACRSSHLPVIACPRHGIQSLYKTYSARCNNSKIDRLNFRVLFPYGHGVHGYSVVNWWRKGTKRSRIRQVYRLIDLSHQMTFPLSLRHIVTHLIVWLISWFEINIATRRVLLIMKYLSIPDMNLYCGYANSTEVVAPTC